MLSFANESANISELTTLWTAESLEKLSRNAAIHARDEIRIAELLLINEKRNSNSQTSLKETKLGKVFMTAFAIVRYKGSTVVFADMLLSSTVSLKANVKLPTAGRTWDRVATMQIAGLAQKIININENIVMVWAGSMSKVREIQEIVQTYFESEGGYVGHTHAIAVNNLLSPYADEDISVAFILRSSKFDTFIISMNCDQSSIDPFEAVISGGSGSGEMVAKLVEVAYRIPKELRFDSLSGDRNDLLVFVNTAEAVLAADFLFHSYAHVHTGGFVDVATFEQNGIVRSSETLFVYWDNELGFPFKIFPFLAIKRSYIDGIVYLSYLNYKAPDFWWTGVGTPRDHDNECLVPPNVFDIFSINIKRVYLIIFKRSGKRSFFAESGAIFRRMFAVSPFFGTLIYNKDYSDEIKRIQETSDKIEYPF